MRLSLTNCVISGNSSIWTEPDDFFDNYGGGLYCTGGSELVNCLLTNNTCQYGYYRALAIFFDGYGVMKNCTVANHQALILCPAVRGYGNSTTITNCIFWNNNSSDLAGLYTASYSCIEQNVTGTGNISSDPCFVSGYRLSQILSGQAVNSPCIDAGSDTAVNLEMEEYTTRTDQFRDKGIVDIGYHYNVIPVSADISQNFHVNFIDYSQMATNWLLCGSANYLTGDINKDECVNENDLDLISQAWLDCYVGLSIAPSPANNATGVAKKPVLSWTAGAGALQHDIYLGTNSSDIINADISSSLYKGRQSSTSWDSSDIYPNGLILGTIYYWRVDEVGACTTKGNIWQFRILAGNAFNPSPAENAVVIEPTSILKWSPGAFALTHDVYFGTNSDDVNTAAVPLTTTDVNSYNPGVLNLTTTYYWRIDEYDGFTKHKGSLWSFTTRSALDTSLVGWWKLDEGTGTSTLDSSDYHNNGTLSGNPAWSTGQIDSALLFDGTDDYIDSGNAPSLNLTDSITISAWVKFNDLNNDHYAILGKGHTTAVNYLLTTARGTDVRDELDFSYRDSSWNWIVYQTSNADLKPLKWTHIAVTFNFGTGSSIKIYCNGSLVGGYWYLGNGNVKPPSNTISLTTGDGTGGALGERKMNGLIDDLRLYNRVLSATEIKAIYTEGLAGKAFNANPQDGNINTDSRPFLSWQTGLNAVSHDIYLGTNSADVNSSTTPLATTDVNSYAPSSLNYGTTYYWRVDEFDGTSIHKGDVWSFTTKSGKASTPSPANMATIVSTATTLTWSATQYAISHDVYFGTSFNDVNESVTPVITITSATYNPGTLNYSTTYYWRIDEFDGSVTVKGDVWSFTTRSALDTSLVGWWKLDEGTGASAMDSSDYHNNGTLNGNPVWTTGILTQALNFDAVDDYVNCGSASSLDITGNISISAWVKFNSLPNSQTIIAKRGSTSDSLGNYILRTGQSPSNDELQFYYRSGSTWHIFTTTNANMIAGTWYNIIVTYTFGTGSSIKCYRNGDLLTGSWTSGNGNAAAGTNTKPVTIGALTNGERANALIDEIRLYNKILSAEEILQITRAGITDKALIRNPQNGAINISPYITLNWSAGILAIEHDIYLGTNSADVNSSTTPLATTDVNSYTPSALNYGTTYYWRVDEYDGNDIHKGFIWNFTTMSGKASSPSPANAAGSVNIHPSLSWTASPYAISHNIYIGTSSSEVANSTTPTATTSSATYNPGTLNYATTYYWRIDEYDGTVTVKGDIWSFTTKNGKASTPSPANAAASVDAHTTLSWTAATYATSHDVYIGTSSSEVANSTTPTATTSSATYNPGTLNYATTYYWRIDENDGTVTIKGDVWRFTTKSGKATTPNPANGGTGQNVILTLGWTAATYAVSHDVYLGTSSADVNSSTTPITTQTGATYNPGTLNYSTIYYWRIDESDGSVTSKGDIWSFITYADPTSNLVGWWKIDETTGTIVHDYAGSNNGTLYGTPVWTGGQIDGAIDLDSNGDYVRIPDNSSLTPASQITIAFWIYARTSGGGIYKWAACPDRGGPGNSRAYSLYMAGGSIYFIIYQAVNTADSIESINTVNLNQWQHITATFNAGVAKVYINGQLDNTKTLSVNSIMNDAQYLTFGGNWAYCSGAVFQQSLNGKMDDVRIYNRALNDGEIQQLYQAGLP